MTNYILETLLTEYTKQAFVQTSRIFHGMCSMQVVFCKDVMLMTFKVFMVITFLKNGPWWPTQENIHESLKVCDDDYLSNRVFQEGCV